MSVQKVTNRAPGPRGFNVFGPDGTPIQILLQPGETKEVDLTGAGHPHLAALIRSGELVIEP